MNIPMIMLSVAAVWTVAVVTPGPNFFITVHTALGRSRRSALWVVAGNSTGTIIWGLCGFFGIALLFSAAPWLYVSVKVLGGLYLIYLGTKLMMRRRNHPMDCPADRSRDLPPLVAWRRGLMTNLTNPKTAAFITSLFAATMPAEAPVGLGLGSVMLMASLSAGWYALVACLFSRERCADLYRRSRHWIDRGAGLVFIGFGLRLASQR